MMYYRQKILLALVEACGGRLKRTDFQKLLFLFCQYTKKNFYDFFPYKYGGFSFLSYWDKSRLESQGLLGGDGDTEIHKGGEERGFVSLSGSVSFVADASFIEQLKPKDQIALKTFVAETDGLRGNALIRKTYLEFPHYACQSEILSKVLSQDEIASLRPSWQQDTSPCLFTIGYEGKSIDAYLNQLLANHVEALVDVRKNPFSMKYGFSKTKLQNYTERVGLRYYHLPALGIPSSLRRDLNSPEAYRAVFEYYRTEILPDQRERLEYVKALLGKHTRIALTCFEKDHRCCHRNQVTEYLTKSADFSTRVIHL